MEQLKKRKIILDVDTGTDDAMAIIIAMLAQELDVIGITVVQGNQPLKYTLENTLRVVELMGGNVPVYGGCPEPMVQTMSVGRMQNQRMQLFEKEVDGKKVNIHDEYLNLPQAVLKPEPQHAVSFIVDTLRNTKEKITLVAVGPATNVGMALRMDPDIANNLEEIVVMGGGVTSVNRTSGAEMNFYMDPEAAQLMIKAKCKVTILPLDATTSALFSREDAKVIAAVGNRPAQFFAELVTHFSERLEVLGINNRTPGCYDIAIHDVMCILYLLDPSIITDLRREKCDVDFAGGYADGMLVVDTRSYVQKDDETYVAYRIDKQKSMDMILSILSRYQG